MSNTNIGGISQALSFLRKSFLNQAKSSDDNRSEESTHQKNATSTAGLLDCMQPLPQHFITSQDQHTRELYTTLLAAVLLSDGHVSEPRSRLFGMLLQSMQLEPVPARFFELAQQLDATKLKQAIHAINHQDQQCAFVIDALILARLDSPLGQMQVELLAELLGFFELSTDLVRHLVAVAGMGLEIPKKNQTVIENLALTIKLSSFSPITTDALTTNLQSYSQLAGTYIDSATGLMWSRISIGQKWVDGNPQGQAETLTWDDANTACEMFRLAGFDDWRLPTKEELESLMIENEAGYQAPEGVLFPPNLGELGDSGLYWSASLYAEGLNHAWYVYFDLGVSNNIRKGYSSHVRAVRTGQ